MEESELNYYLGIGFIVGIATAWIVILLSNTDSVFNWIPAIALVVTITAVVIPIISIIRNLVISSTPIGADDVSLLAGIKLLVFWATSFVGTLLLLLLPVLLGVIIFRQVDGNEFRDAIYQGIDWRILLGGLVFTILGGWIPLLKKTFA